MHMSIHNRRHSNLPTVKTTKPAAVQSLPEVKTAFSESRVAGLDLERGAVVHTQNERLDPKIFFDMCALNAFLISCIQLFRFL